MNKIDDSVLKLQPNSGDEEPLELEKKIENPPLPFTNLDSDEYSFIKGYN